MEISDNGIGFDVNHKVRNDSYGMIGMKERVLLLDGELNISSEPGKGTCLRVEMPYLAESIKS
jgi:signal transduction histidine kinase